MEPVGSRGWESINYYETCLISGLDTDKNCHMLLNNSAVPCIILNKQLVDYCLEYLNFKVGYVGEPNDAAMKWVEDEWWYNSGKVFRHSVLDDFQSTSNVINRFNETLKKVHEQNSRK